MTIELSHELDRHFRLLGVQAIAHDAGVILRRGTTRTYLAGDGVMGLLARIVDASRAGGVSETQLKKSLPREDWALLDGVMEALTSRRFLVPLDPERADTDPQAVEDPDEVYYWEFGSSRTEAWARLADRQVPVIGDNGISRHLLAMLHRCGMTGAYLVDHPQFKALGPRPDDLEPGLAHDDWAASSAPDRADVFVVCSDFGGLSLMREWNEYCHGVGTPFMPVVLQDHTAYVGPLVIPGSSPCFECLWLRQNSNLDDPLVKRASEHLAYYGQHANGYLPPMASAAADFAAMELVKHFTQLLPGGSVGTLLEIDLAGPALTPRKLLKVPYCPVCSATSGHPVPAVDRVVFMPGNDPE